MKWQWLFTFWLILQKCHKTCPIKPAARQSKQKCPGPSGSSVVADQSFSNHTCLEAGLASVGDPWFCHSYPHQPATAVTTFDRLKFIHHLPAEHSHEQTSSGLAHTLGKLSPLTTVYNLLMNEAPFKLVLRAAFH